MYVVSTVVLCAGTLASVAAFAFWPNGRKLLTEALKHPRHPTMRKRQRDSLDSRL